MPAEYLDDAPNWERLSDEEAAFWEEVAFHERLSEDEEERVCSGD